MVAFVTVVPPETATGPMKQQYEFIRESMGIDEYINLAKSWSLVPEVAQAWMNSQSVARRASGLTDLQYELMECRIMYLTKSRYVLVNHSVLLTRLSGWSHDQLKQNIQDPEHSSLDTRDKAILRFAGKVATQSHLTTQHDVDVLREHGFTDAEVIALVFLIGSLVLNGILPNALGSQLDEFSKGFRDLSDW